MSNLTSKHKTRGQAFANKLAEMAPLAPDPMAKRCVYATVNRLREIYGFSDDEKRDLIREALDLGCTTYDDLARETRIHRPTIVEIIKDMENAKAVTISYMSKGDKGGRPMAYIRTLLR